MPWTSASNSGRWVFLWTGLLLFKDLYVFFQKYLLWAGWWLPWNQSIFYESAVAHSNSSKPCVLSHSNSSQAYEIVDLCCSVRERDTETWNMEHGPAGIVFLDTLPKRYAQPNFIIKPSIGLQLVLRALKILNGLRILKVLWEHTLIYCWLQHFSGRIIRDRNNQKVWHKWIGKLMSD